MVCSIAYQWYPKKEVHVLALPDLPGYDPEKPTNKLLIKEFAKVLSEADVAVGHNIDSFDDPMVKTDLIKNGQSSPPHYRTIDTLKLLKTKFRFNSNKLDDVCQELGIGKKVPHEGFGLWEKCMKGDGAAWAKMRAYNRGDIVLLRELYERLRSWFPTHPNLAVDSAIPACPYCKHPVLSSDGWRHTQAKSYRRMICLKCRSRCKAVPLPKGGYVYRA